MRAHEIALGRCRPPEPSRGIGARRHVVPSVPCLEAMYRRTRRRSHFEPVSSSYLTVQWTRGGGRAVVRAGKMKWLRSQQARETPGTCHGSASQARPVGMRAQHECREPHVGRPCEWPRQQSCATRHPACVCARGPHSRVRVLLERDVGAVHRYVINVPQVRAVPGRRKSRESWRASER